MAALVVGTQAAVTQETRIVIRVIPVAATLEIPAAVVRAAEATPATATQVEEIPATRVVVRKSRRVISEIASSAEAVESPTIGPSEKADRK